MNEFLFALTSLFVRPHSSPINQATKTNHRVQLRDQNKHNSKTSPGHKAQPQHSGAQPKQGQEEDNAQPQSPAQRTRRRQKPNKPSIAHERARALSPWSLSIFLSFFLSIYLSFFLSFLPSFLPFFLSSFLSFPFFLPFFLLGTEPSHRVDRVEGRPRGGQEEDKAPPQSPATELTEFRGAQSLDREPSHTAQPQS